MHHSKSLHRTNLECPIGLFKSTYISTLYTSLPPIDHGAFLDLDCILYIVVLASGVLLKGRENDER